MRGTWVCRCSSIRRTVHEPPAGTADSFTSGPVSTTLAEPGIGLPWGQLPGSPSSATRCRSRLSLMACSSRQASSCTCGHGTFSTSTSSTSASRCLRSIEVAVVRGADHAFRVRRLDGRTASGVHAEITERVSHWLAVLLGAQTET